MKNYLKSTTTALAMCSLFVFAACESEEISPEASTLAARQAQDAHRANSLNLNKTYMVEIKSLNNSGVSGMATLDLMGDELTVHIQASGLEPGMVHPQHIHGFENNNQNAVCPPMSADTDGDGLVELAEGLPFYGSVLLSLEPFPVAPDGTINYTRTFYIGDKVSLLPLQNDVIVLHGMTVDGEYVATLPVACGAIQPTNNGK